MVFAASPSDPTALAHPTGFTPLNMNQGVNVWEMKPPDGYMALGNCLSNHLTLLPNGPDPSQYWCVRADLLQEAAVQYPLPVFKNGAPPPTAGQIAILPQTVLFSAAETAWALLLDQAVLDVTPSPPPDPPADKSIFSGSKSALGLDGVKILPFTAMTIDAAYPNQQAVSPFYYVAAQSYWQCIWSNSTPAGATQSFQVIVGVDNTESQTFEHSTSFSVSADSGVEIKGVTSGVSVSYTDDFSLSCSTTTENSSSADDTLTLPIPAAPRSWLHQRWVEITVFRGDASQVGSIAYGCEDHRLVQGAD